MNFAFYLKKTIIVHFFNFTGLAFFNVLVVFRLTFKIGLLFYTKFL